MIAQVKTSTDLSMPDDTAALTDVMYQVADDTIREYYTLTFINNTDHIVYPFLWATNDAEQCSTSIDDNGQKHYACSNYDPTDPTKNPGSIYDPIDPWKEDYRGYIGYTGADGTNYLGIPAGKTATITVPLVFWDGARIYIASDGTYLISPIDTQYHQSNPPINPYNFFWKNQDGTPTKRCHQPMQNQPFTSPDLNVVVLWYHGDVATGPANDAPAQLLEFTLRHPWQQKLNQNLPADILGPLANYDVSYVDTIYLPVAMEADDFTDGQTAYGWIGASQTEDQFQQAFRDFTSADPTQNGLGQYFGGRGYTQYYFPAALKANVGIKLPSGAQALGDSPFTGHPSSFDNYKNTLLSADTQKIDDFQVGVSIVPVELDEQHKSKVMTVTLNGADASPSGDDQRQTLQDALNAGIVVSVTSDDSNLKGCIPLHTQLTDYQPDPVNPYSGTATVNQAIDFSAMHSGGYSITFTPAITDYVATPIMNLWYSWAQYYINHNPAHNQSTQTQTGSITVPDEGHSNVLVFASPIPVSETILVPGMQVTGPEIPGSLCTILDVVKSHDGQFYQSVSLSEFVSSGVSNGRFTFVAPPTIAGTDATDPLTGDRLINPFPLTFSGEDAVTALAFSQAVYQVMSAMSTIPVDSSPSPQPLQLLFNVIGCNVGQIPNIGLVGSTPDSLISGAITNKVKSVLRGVPNFNVDPESQWYPDPSVPTGGCNFNVFNLDPFVWFVHKKLGMSGYGFSVDDDIADVGANNAQNLKIAIGGLNGLPNQNPWVSQ